MTGSAVMGRGAGRRGLQGLRGPLLLVAAFLTVGVVAALVVVNTLTEAGQGPVRGYSAEFTGAEGLAEGDAVTAAGVRVGRVDAVTREDLPDGGARALVRFSVRSDVHLDARTAAAIRYGDMLGVRYLALTAPLAPSGSELAAGARIPLDRTSPPLDLTAVFNGFEPLFQALDPARANALARSVTAAFGGDDGAMTQLLGQVARISGDLLDHRDALDRVVANLGALAEAADARGGELTRLIDGLARMGGTLAGRNAQLIEAVEHGQAAARASARLLDGREDTLASALERMRAMTASWVDNSADFDRTMDVLVPFTRAVGRIGDYGSWLQLYTCTVTAKAGDAEVNLLGPAHSEVCR